MPLDESLFRFQTELQVRNYEVDWQGIVHNAVYLLYFETGRVEYLQHLGITVDMETIRKESRIVVARNEIDYLASAHFGDKLQVLTRISYIRGSSFGFEGILRNSLTGMRVAENLSINVRVDETTGKPRNVGRELREAVESFENGNAAISWPPGLA
jgi:acyl-CoA thioester hydrolase